MVNRPDCAPASVGLNRTTTSVKVAAGSVNGPAGVTVNLLFELVMEVIVKLAFPLLSRVSGTVAKLPGCTEPKLIEVGEVLSCGPVPAVPIPERGSDTRGDAGSLLAKVKMPACAPPPVGAKRTATCVVAPGAIEKGPAGETVNIAFELVTDDTVSVPVPLLETLTDCVAVLPAATDPNDRVDG